jgi:hypothetical protein
VKAEGTWHGKTEVAMLKHRQMKSRLEGGAGFCIHKTSYNLLKLVIAGRGATSQEYSELF